MTLISLVTLHFLAECVMRMQGDCILFTGNKTKKRRLLAGPLHWSFWDNIFTQCVVIKTRAKRGSSLFEISVSPGDTLGTSYADKSCLSFWNLGMKLGWIGPWP